MFFWTPYGFVRLTFFLIAGIVTAIYLPGVPGEWAGIILFVNCGLAVLWLQWKTSSQKMAGPLIVLMVFLAGYLHTIYQTQSLNARHFMYAGEAKLYTAVINSYPEEKARSWKCEARVDRIYDGREWHEVSGKVLLYFSREDFERPYRYGDELLIHGKPSQLHPPANPGEFDYKRFLSYRNVYHQQFLRVNQLEYIGNDPTYPWLASAYKARAWAEQVLRKNIQGDRERAVASALVLGIKDGLDNDLVNAYASSGAMHVLAVSGLHVGILYLLLRIVLRPLERRRNGRVLFAVLSIAALWFYAFFTGLSPSVLRAVTMFSVLAGARAMNYPTSIFNTLAFTAFVLLLLDPYMIMAVGFQLSFLAVIGIVYLQPRLYRLWVPRNIIIDKIWQITCVSMAAQVATFALGLLYYHQFPVYFLVSNLFVIPGALLSLGIGIFLIAVGGIPPLAAVAGNIFEDLLFMLNDLVYRVEAFPYSLLTDIRITTFQSWLLMGLIISVLLMVEYRRFAFVIAMGAFGILFGVIQWYHDYRVVQVPKFTVYQVRGESAMEWMEDGKSYFFARESLIQDKERMRFHIRPNRLMHGIRTVVFNSDEFMVEYPGFRLFAWSGLRIGQLTEPLNELPVNSELDYLVVSLNAVRKLDHSMLSNVKHIIIDSSNSYFTASRLLDEATRKGIQVYSVLHEGAFVAQL